MTKVAEKQRVAVIGGGLAGLSAAVNLARQGMAVTLFERSPHAGGRAQTTVKDGYYINFGPHAHYVGAAGRPFLKELGIEPTGNPPANKRAFAFFNGKTQVLPLSLQAIFKTNLLNLGDKVRLLKFFLGLQSIKEESIEHLTVDQWIDSDKNLGGGGMALKGFVQTLAKLTTYTGDTTRLSASAALHQIQLAVKTGVIYLHGGWAQMVDALLKRAEELGVEVISGCEVTGVSKTAETGEFAVLFKDKDLGFVNKTFKGIILAVPPEVVSKLVSSKPTAADQVPLLLGGEQLTDVKAACLDICLKELPRPENTFALGIDEPTYFSVHSAAAELTPPNGALIHVAYYLKGGEVGTAQIEKRLEEIMDTLQPGWRDKLVYRRYLANIVVTHKLLSVKNGKLGGYWTEETNEPGVFVAGDWVGTEQLADGSLASAKRSSELLIAHLRATETLTQPAELCMVQTRVY